MGPSETIVDVWSWVVWALVIIVFIVLFNLRACTNNFSASEQKIEGELNQNIPDLSYGVAYLNTRLDYCSFAKANDLDNLTPVDLVNYFIKKGLKEKAENLYSVLDDEKKLKNSFNDELAAKSYKVWHECMEVFFNDADKRMSYYLEDQNGMFMYQNSELMHLGTINTWITSPSVEILIPTDNGTVLFAYRMFKK